MSYIIARCKICQQEIHVHKKPGKTWYTNLCEHVTGKKDIYYRKQPGGNTYEIANKV